MTEFNAVNKYLGIPLNYENIGLKVEKEQLKPVQIKANSLAIQEFKNLVDEQITLLEVVATKLQGKPISYSKAFSKLTPEKQHEVNQESKQLVTAILKSSSKINSEALEQIGRALEKHSVDLVRYKSVAAGDPSHTASVQVKNSPVIEKKSKELAARNQDLFLKTESRSLIDANTPSKILDALHGHWMEGSPLDVPSDQKKALKHPALGQWAETKSVLMQQNLEGLGRLGVDVMRHQTRLHMDSGGKEVQPKISGSSTLQEKYRQIDNCIQAFGSALKIPENDLQKISGAWEETKAPDDGKGDRDSKVETSFQKFFEKLKGNDFGENGIKMGQMFASISQHHYARPIGADITAILKVDNKILFEWQPVETGKPDLHINLTEKYVEVKHQAVMANKDLDKPAAGLESAPASVIEEDIKNNYPKGMGKGDIPRCEIRFENILRANLNKMDEWSSQISVTIEPLMTGNDKADKKNMERIEKLVITPLMDKGLHVYID
jgi:hypothetical protein